MASRGRKVIWDSDALRIAIVLTKVRQSQLAVVLGLSPEMMSRICLGMKCPTPDQRRIIAEELGAAEEDLFRDMPVCRVLQTFPATKG